MVAIVSEESELFAKGSSILDGVQDVDVKPIFIQRSICLS
jgi:hypothetical protein